MTGKNFRFMVVIPARNEENVIQDIIKSLKKQTYSRFDIFVIADNCSDHTARDARLEGAIVYERNDLSKKTKGYALEWFFGQILKEKCQEYDAICIFDADNLVKEDFLEKINDKFSQGAKIVQGYRDIKNPGKSWISDNYAVYYWMMNRFYHEVRYQIGLSPMVNGTGFAFSMELLKKTNGWHSSTLTEDIEFSIENIMNGEKIAWAKDAILYDEQPTAFRQSFRQRLRWSVGHIQCFCKFFFHILKNGKMSATQLDTFIYLMGMPLFLCSFVFLLINLFQGASDVWLIRMLIILMFSTILTAFLLYFDKKNIKKVWKGIATYPIFLLSWLIVNVVAFFVPHLEWKPITHTSSD